MRHYQFLIFFFIVLYVPYSYSSGPVADSLVLIAAEAGDKHTIKEYLDKGIDINAYYGEEELTLMAFSIQVGQADITELLIQKGADVEKICDRKTPLMFAAKNNRTEVVPILLLGGARINSINGARNSALHYAAKYNQLEFVKVLCENGASVNLLNEDGWTAMDFAIISKRKDIEDYLTGVGGRIYPKIMPTCLDGPYMEMVQTDKLNVFYLSHDSLENKSRIISELHEFNTSSLNISGFDKDEESYIISKYFTPPPSVYKDVPRIMAIGDIHGQYSRMILMLQSAGVIDDNLQWQWGDGHLVFMGDIFDRGNEVTECLWFIYKLERQAEQQQGKVHLLLGNHEVMILNNDLRYISNLYYGLAGNLQLDYSELYNRNTILGRWLRTKNTIEIINNLIFVHAGLSPHLVAKNLSIDSTNNAIRASLNSSTDSYPEELEDFLMGNLGPIWYRGYIRNSRQYPRITTDELHTVLSFFNAESIIVGHTETDTIKSLYNSAVIDVNIPLWNEDISEQALLIENNRYYRIYANGRREVLVEQDSWKTFVRKE